jgi:hypothetical protein
MKWTGHIASIAERRSTYVVLMVKPEGKKLLARQRHRWDDNIRKDIREKG